MRALSVFLALLAGSIDVALAFSATHYPPIALRRTSLPLAVPLGCYAPQPVVPAHDARNGGRTQPLTAVAPAAPRLWLPLFLLAVLRMLHRRLHLSRTWWQESLVAGLDRLGPALWGLDSLGGGSAWICPATPRSTPASVAPASRTPPPHPTPASHAPSAEDHAPAERHETRDTRLVGLVRLDRAAEAAGAALMWRRLGAFRGGSASSEPELRRAFSAIDTDGSGTVDSAELNRHLRQHVDEAAAEAATMRMIEFADADSNGMLSFEEYRSLVLAPYPAGFMTRYIGGGAE